MLTHVHRSAANAQKAIAAGLRVARVEKKEKGVDPFFAAVAGANCAPDHLEQSSKFKAQALRERRVPQPRLLPVLFAENCPVPLE